MSANAEADDQTNRQATLGLTTLAALVVANMIGVGVFTSSGYSMAALGNPGRVLLAWVLCGGWAIAGAVAYGALASRLPLSGGEYLFLSRLAHPGLGFLAGWISLVAGFTAPIAAAALGAAVYCLPASATPEQMSWFAGGLIAVVSVCHVVGVSLGASLQNAIVISKLLLIAVLIGWAFLATGPDAWQGGPLPDRDPNWLPGNLADWRVLAGSMTWIALSYTGFNAAIYVAGESRRAAVLVPRAMLLATVLVTVIYLALNIVFVYAPLPEAIAGQEAVAAIAAQAVGGTSLATLLRVTIALAMVSSVFAMLLAGPRVYQKMAEDGVMPRMLAATGRPPRLATAVQAMLSIVAAFAASLLELMTYLGLTLSVCGAFSVIAVWFVRRRLPHAQPLEWWERLAILVYLAITACILIGAWSEKRWEFVAMLITFVVGMLAYWGSRKLGLMTPLLLASDPQRTVSVVQDVPGDAAQEEAG